MPLWYSVSQDIKPHVRLFQIYHELDVSMEESNSSVHPPDYDTVSDHLVGERVQSYSGAGRSSPILFIVMLDR